MAMINNANDVLFDLCTRLKDNGVVAKVSGDYEFSEDNISFDFVERISELDFTEHDKGFKYEIRQLKHELEEKRRFETDRFVKLPFDALETANMLINATYSRKTSNVEKAFTGCNVAKEDIYSIDYLEQIAEHLLVYCKHNKEGMMNMCEFCDGKEKRIENGFTYGNAHIAKNNFGYSYSLRYDNSVNEYGEGAFEINYCPICGRKLVK